MARKFFAGRNPVGRTFFVKYGDNPDPPVEIIGVVKDAKYASLREKPRSIAYFPSSQRADPDASNYVIRADGQPTSLIGGVKAVVARINPGATLQFTTLSAVIDDSLRRDRLLATLSAFFGGLALLVATIGLYGTMAYGIARRRNEIGVRIALGASAGRLARMVLGEIGITTAIGVVLGVAIALASARLLASFLFELKPTDPWTLALAVLVMSAAAIAAGVGPAWRAARMDPVTALRAD
jgi:ABC-type antimicrobial peptide transport system permease subunit